MKLEVHAVDRRPSSVGGSSATDAIEKILMICVLLQVDQPERSIQQERDIARQMKLACSDRDWMSRETLRHSSLGLIAIRLHAPGMA
jgi:actin-related protein